MGGLADLPLNLTVSARSGSTGFGSKTSSGSGKAVGDATTVAIVDNSGEPTEEPGCASGVGEASRPLMHAESRIRLKTAHR
jgi:hypothetical protein